MKHNQAIKILAMRGTLSRRRCRFVVNSTLTDGNHIKAASASFATSIVTCPTEIPSFSFSFLGKAECKQPRFISHSSDDGGDLICLCVCLCVVVLRYFSAPRGAAGHCRLLAGRVEPGARFRVFFGFSLGQIFCVSFSERRFRVGWGVLSKTTGILREVDGDVS